MCLEIKIQQMRYDWCIYRWKPTSKKQMMYLELEMQIISNGWYTERL